MIRMLAAAAVAASSPFAAASESMARFEIFERVAQAVSTRSEIEQEPVVRREYLRLFAGAFEDGALAQATNAELRALLRAADTMGFFSIAEGDARDVDVVLRELMRRGVATDDDHATYFRTLVARREFAAAARHRAAHPGMDTESIPQVTDGSQGDGPIVYEPSVDSFAVTKRRVAIGSGVHLVVVSHPLCAFSRSAMQDIAADPVLSGWLGGRATWLAPPYRRLYVDALQAWKREHPETPVVLAHRREDWPFIRIWSTPTFYVLKDGRLFGAFQGWPKDGGRTRQLRVLLEAAGKQAVSK
jgi:hypothetical protein